MTTIQNYQQLKNGEQALSELECLTGSQFDETLVKAFRDANPEIIVKNSICTDDRAFRYGGDKIAVVMPEVMLGQAHIIIKRIQRNAKWWKHKSA